MRHISTSEGGIPRAMFAWSAPNLVIFTRSTCPPVASLVTADEIAKNEEADSLREPASGAKQELRGMSAKSSLNIARVLSTLDWQKLGRCLHVTLTYWRLWPADKAALQDEKNRLGTWFQRNCECGIWRLEFQTRKNQGGLRVPHWHVLAFVGVRDVGVFMDSVRAWWGASGYSEYANDHEQGVHFSDGDGRASWYFSLHAAKREQAPPFRVGRWWGYVHRDVLLSFQRLYSLGEVLDRERVWWARLYRRSTGCKTRNEAGFSWFLSAAGQTQARIWVGERCAFEKVTRGFGGKPF